MTVAKREFYVYGHKLAGTETYFHIGKGIGNRMTAKKGRHFLWHEILKKHSRGFDYHKFVEGLTEDEALDIEKKIQWEYTLKGNPIIDQSGDLYVDNLDEILNRADKIKGDFDNRHQFLDLYNYFTFLQKDLANVHHVIDKLSFGGTPFQSNSISAFFDYVSEQLVILGEFNWLFMRWLLYEKRKLALFKGIEKYPPTSPHLSSTAYRA